MNGTGRYPKALVDTAKVPVVGQAGGVLLTETVRVSGLTAGLSTALAPRAKDGAIHDPGKVLTDLAITLALGGDTLSDLGVLRGEPGVYGLVASDPTVSRLIADLGADADRAEAAIGKARAAARAAAWAAAGEHAPDAAASAADPITVDLDATLITAHSKEGVRETDVQARVRVPPAVRVRRPRAGRLRGSAGDQAPARERGLEHGEGPHRRREAGPRPAARGERVEAGEGRGRGRRC